MEPITRNYQPQSEDPAFSAGVSTGKMKSSEIK
jgi:hypothetical protein